MDYLEYFRDLVPRLDDAGHVVSAQDINALQELVENLQREAFYRRDEDFLRMLMDVLEHQPDLNAMWIELLEDNSMLDLSNSLGIKFDENSRSVGLAEESLQGYVTSRVYFPHSKCAVKRVMLFVMHNVPSGDTAVYELSNNGLDFYPVEANTGHIVELPTSGSRLYIRIKLNREDHDHPGPLVGAWSVLYYDSTIEVDLNASLTPEFDPDDPYLPEIPIPQPVKLRHADLLEIGPDDHHPKIHRHSGEEGENDKINLREDIKGVLPWEHLPPDLWPFVGYLSIIRDPEQDDRVVRVEGEDLMIRMFYNGDILQSAVIERGDVTTTVQLEWNEYTYVDGTTETVVTGVDIDRSEVEA